MTITCIVIIIIAALFGLGLAAFLFYVWIDLESTAFCIAGIITAAVTIAICFGIGWWQLNSESGRRALKDQQAELNGGIERTVSVYDINGDLIEKYTGRFDIETDRESYILFDDEAGKRHMIYYTTGTVIIDEN